MKTNMFKSFSKEERRNKLERILRKKTNQQITEEMINAIFNNVDMSNQLFINFYDRSLKFEEACKLKKEINDESESSIVKVEEKAEVIYGELYYTKTQNNVIYNNTLPQIILKTRKNIYSNQASEWDYILIIYIPEKK